LAGIVAGIVAESLAQTAGDPSEELGRAERLRDVVIGTELQPAHDGVLLAHPREDEDGHRGPDLGSDLLEEVQPVPVGEVEIEEDDVVATVRQEFRPSTTPGAMSTSCPQTPGCARGPSGRSSRPRSPGSPPSHLPMHEKRPPWPLSLASVEHGTC
jgi:hypothetical protein